MRFCGGRSTPAIRAMRAPQFVRGLSLTLFVLRVDANYAYDPAPVDDLALITNFLNRCPDFHFPLLDKYRPARSGGPAPVFTYIGTRCDRASGRTEKAQR